MSETSKGILKRVNHLQEGDSSRDLYDDWSKNYDAHLVEDFGYISPQIVVQTLVSQNKKCDVEIIDYGCGTGLVGEELHKQGFVHWDSLPEIFRCAFHRAGYQPLSSHIRWITMHTTV